MTKCLFCTSFLVSIHKSALVCALEQSKCIWSTVNVLGQYVLSNPYEVVHLYSKGTPRLCTARQSPSQCVLAVQVYHFIWAVYNMVEPGCGVSNKEKQKLPRNPFPCKEFPVALELLNIICCQIWYQSKIDYMDRAKGSRSITSGRISGTSIVDNEKQIPIQNWNYIINPCIPFIIWNLFSYWYSSQQKSWKIAACHEYHRPASLVYCWWWHFLWPMFSHSWAQLSLVGKKYLT